jgi:hypothetical protein
MDFTPHNAVAEPAATSSVATPNALAAYKTALRLMGEDQTESFAAGFVNETVPGPVRGLI